MPETFSGRLDKVREAGGQTGFSRCGYLELICSVDSGKGNFKKEKKKVRGGTNTIW